jgi:PST family polysaccharide transporter
MRALLQRKFVRDTLALQAGKIFNVGISFAASVVVARLMQPTAYGEWALTVSFFGLWQSLNLTGLTSSTITRLSAAVGARDSAEALNLIGFYVRVAALWAVICFLLLATLGAPLAARLYTSHVVLPASPSFSAVFTLPEPTIGVMAAIYALVLFPDSLYTLVLITLQSRRLMRVSAALENVNQIMLTACIIGALLISPTLIGMVIGRLAYSISTMGVALLLYARGRNAGNMPFPSFRQIVERTRTVPLRPYLRFGFFISLDRSVASLFIQVAMQLVGIQAGKEAAGYLQLAMKAMQLPNTLTSAIFDNMQAVVPQAVGRGDFRRLWHNFTRVLLTLTLGSAAFYSAVIVFALTLGPAVVPLLYGSEWSPAVPLLAVLAVFGAVTTVGGVFGPLYRALNIVGKAAVVKAIALAVSVLPGIWLVSQYGAAGGAWMITLVYTLSVAFTALITLPVLRQRVEQP